MKPQGWWDKAEFEERVARALMMCFEDKITTVMPVAPEGKRYSFKDAHAKPTQRDLDLIRKHGPYFAPQDRLTIHGLYDYKLDGMPQYTCLAHSNDEIIYNQQKAYMLAVQCNRVYTNSLPDTVRFPIGMYAAFYRMTLLQPMQAGDIDAYAYYIAVRRDGEILTENNYYQAEGIIKLASMSLTLYADRKYLWNVQANEHIAKASFGVYEEQIKSLFYARQLPMTATGRKRPILHWVNAHQRRMKEGIDVDIDKYLRGTEEFLMDGTKFSITQPRKV